MLKRYKGTLLIYLVSYLALCQAQTQESEIPTRKQVEAEYAKYQSFDFINHDYKYLDEDFKILMDDDLFNHYLKIYEFYPEMIVDYSDSLAVVLCAEFDNWPQRTIARARITLSWIRLSYMLWISDHETKQIAKRYDIELPYLLYEYIYHQEEFWDDFMKEFAADLRNRVYAETADEDVLVMDWKNLFDYAHVKSPQRIADAKAAHVKN